jgi:hypothetical protein
MKTAARLTLLRSVLATLVLLLGAHSTSHAQGGCDNCGHSTPAPEIDPSLGSGGVALLGGAILLLRARRRQ